MKAIKSYLSQKGYIEKVFYMFNMLNAKAVNTPLAIHFKISSAFCPRSDQDIDYMSHVLYSSTVGSVMYAMVCVRPDLVHIVGRYMANLDNEKQYSGFLDT